MNLRYIDSIKGASLAFVIFVLAVLYIPGVGPSQEVENILTISTFLFAILAGFFISRLGKRYDQMRLAIGEEDALFLSFYKNCQIYGKQFSDKIKELIDKYYIICYDFVVGKAYKPGSKYFLQMWDEVINIRKYRRDVSYQVLLQDLEGLERVRNLSSALHEEKLSVGQWAILVFLSGIILFSIFYLKTGALYSQIITVLLSTVLVLVLLITRDLQNYMFGGKSLLEESGEEVFEFIGKKRYYNHYMLRKGINKVPKNIKEYRLGLHKPGDEKFDIKNVRIE